MFYHFYYPCYHQSKSSSERNTVISIRFIRPNGVIAMAKESGARVIVECLFPCDMNMNFGEIVVSVSLYALDNV